MNVKKIPNYWDDMLSHAIFSYKIYQCPSRAQIMLPWYLREWSTCVSIKCCCAKYIIACIVAKKFFPASYMLFTCLFIIGWTFKSSISFMTLPYELNPYSPFLHISKAALYSFYFSIHLLCTDNMILLKKMSALDVKIKNDVFIIHLEGKLSVFVPCQKVFTHFDFTRMNCTHQNK